MERKRLSLPRLLHGIRFQAASATVLELGRTHLQVRHPVEQNQG
jgi:hypothetical protein